MPYSPMDDMEDHHQHQHEQHQQHYGLITDLRQLMNGPPSMHQQPQLLTAELFPGHHRNLPPPLANTSNHHHQHYDMMMFGCDMLPRGLHHHHHEFASTDSAGGGGGGGGGGITTTSVSTPPLSGLEAEAAGCIGGDASTGRWPRQETLTLLEIRSRLDPKFKEANQKGPLWEEVSRIMSEEHGYQRSGKKCREKFENLYKYYKKTKEGKAGRQDGKHYRFFRQLEALYGENSNMSSAPETSFGVNLGFNTSSHFPSQTNQEAMFQSHNKHNCDTISLTNSTEFDTSSSDHNSIEGLIMENIDDSMEKGRKKRKSGGRSWKVKIKDFIDSQMRKLVEKQEEWLHKLVKTLEEKENERVLREEEWRKQEAIRLEKEHKFWAKERAWIEARDAALMGALQKLIGRDEIKAEEGPHEGVMAPHEIRNQNQNEDGNEIVLHSNVIGGADDCWQESEITRLQQFTQSGYSEEVNWEEVANKMACFGYERTALMCKEKWESINNFDAMEGNIKELKGNSRSLFYFENNVQYSLYNSNQGSAYSDVNDQRHNTNK